MELKGRNIKLTIDGVEVPVCNIESISLRSDTPIINGVVPPQIEQTLYKFRTYVQGFDEVVLEMIPFTGLPPVMETAIYPWTNLELIVQTIVLGLCGRATATILVPVGDKEAFGNMLSTDEKMQCQVQYAHTLVNSELMGIDAFKYPRNEKGAHHLIATIAAKLRSQYIRGEAPF